MEENEIVDVESSETAFNSSLPFVQTLGAWPDCWEMWNFSGSTPGEAR